MGGPHSSSAPRVSLNEIYKKHIEMVNIVQVSPSSPARSNKSPVPVQDFETGRGNRYDNSFQLSLACVVPRRWAKVALTPAYFFQSKSYLGLN